MKSDELLDAIGEAKDEYVHDVRNGKVRKMPFNFFFLPSSPFLFHPSSLLTFLPSFFPF